MLSVARTVEGRLAPELLRIFFPLFQEGVELEVEVGCTIKQLLVGQFGIAADYLSARITTLFLNNRAVDDVATAVITDGSVLALSGAMPGLVGATMRSGGYYAAMRGAMTYANDQQEVPVKQGRIKLKLFNLLLEELGPRVMQWGILLRGARFNELLAAQPEGFRLRDCRLDGRTVVGETLQTGRRRFEDAALVKLTVSFGGE